MQAYVTAAILTIAALATAGVILRPFNLHEAIWALAGAVLLVALRLISPAQALAGVAKGTDVYLFLFGMMLLADRPRGRPVRLAGGDCDQPRPRLGAPAVPADLLRRHGGHDLPVERCDRGRAHARGRRGGRNRQGETAPALSADLRLHRQRRLVRPADLDPANLVIYGSRMPPLLRWLPSYLLP